MNTTAPKHSATSIRARLFNHAKERGDDFQRVLTRYAIERLLFRLSQTEAVERYVLKGAMLFVTWPEHVFRPSGDLDLLGQGNPDPDAITELFTRICQVDVADDGIVFEPATLKVEPVREADKYQGVRLSLKGELAKAVIHVQVDIGFGDYVYPPPKYHIFPSLLQDLPAANILMYPPETVVAEKFEAMIRFGEANGRIKDFHDMWVMTRTFSFDMPTLVEAVGGTPGAAKLRSRLRCRRALPRRSRRSPRSAAFGAASCAETRRPFNRHLSRTCKRSYGASLAPSSPTSRCRKAPKADGTQMPELGAESMNRTPTSTANTRGSRRGHQQWAPTAESRRSVERCSHGSEDN
ncbi:nucleotidyl transferase AbiEii/AbiGii toxin family protein [Ralstonia syzygii subsp. celebesensis]